MQKEPQKLSRKSKETPAASKSLAQPAVGLHNLIVPRGAHKRKRIIGRGPGSGHGKTSTRGSKGQTSRAGRDFYLGFEGGQTPIIRRMPKRGFVNMFRKEYQIVSLNQIARLKVDVVNPKVLVERGMIKSLFQPVKILGDGEITTAITIQAHAFSKSAQEKLKKSGSVFEVLHLSA